MHPRAMPGNLFAKVFGDHVPRLCVNVVIVDPARYRYKIEFDSELYGLRFVSDDTPRVVLKERDRLPDMGSWEPLGGTVFKGETIAEAAQRIALHDFGAPVEVRGVIGHLEFPNEHYHVNAGSDEIIECDIDNVSLAVLAHAPTEALSPPEGAKVRWCERAPIAHYTHTPFLIRQGLLLP